MSARAFEIKPAVREAVGLLLGLVGPSGTGKTFSALRLASGIQRVVGGSIDFIDTENGRALYYADRFKFNHMRFAAPFSPQDYLDAIEFCVKRGSKIIVVDSMSFEHEGPGGVLEMHEAEVQRLSGGDAAKAERVKMLAWSKPKAARRKMINAILQMNVNIIFCFRAKEKVKVVPGRQPESRGFQPIAGEEFIYEMVAKCLLLPGANGIPSWTSDNADERAMMKLPEQFKTIFAEQKQLDEEIGVKLAQWASGTRPIPTVEEYAACKDAAALEDLEKRRQENWRAAPAALKPKLKEAADAAGARIRSAPAAARPAIDNDTGELLIDVPATEARLRAAKTKTELNNAWVSVLAAFPNAADIPLELTAARDEMMEVLP